MKQKSFFAKSRLIPAGMMLVFTFVLFLTGARAQSLLWKITGSDLPGPSYLYGTIHLTDPRVFGWKDSVYERLDQCQTFEAELDLGMENMMKAAGMMLLPDNETLHDRFTPEEYNQIAGAVKSCSGYDLTMFDKLKPPALIAICFSVKKPGNLEATVDELLYQHAKQKGISTYGIETVEEQMAVLDKIPDSYVLEYFRNVGKQDQEFESLIRCYRNADLDSLLVLITNGESGVLLNDELIRLRNYRMAERVIPLIRKQKVFIAIGSGHLPGEEGVISLLRKEGLVVEPVRIW